MTRNDLISMILCFIAGSWVANLTDGLTIVLPMILAGLGFMLSGYELGKKTFKEASK